ncbi:hypothetical protein HanIR_Chr02g0060781 [Helianthus annuus]|nr:hypothetical protein HanIR_Chr02g0060781 [Helianthus annuus]
MAGDDVSQENRKTDGGASNHTSPFYLHPSDYPRQMHVNETLTDNMSHPGFAEAWLILV